MCIRDSCVFFVKPDGTLNSKKEKKATGKALSAYQNLAFPILLFVRSIILPIITSDTPSKNLESIMITVSYTHLDVYKRQA